MHVYWSKKFVYVSDGYLTRKCHLVSNVKIASQPYVANITVGTAVMSSVANAAKKRCDSCSLFLILYQIVLICFKYIK